MLEDSQFFEQGKGVDYVVEAGGFFDGGQCKFAVGFAVLFFSVKLVFCLRST